MVALLVVFNHRYDNNLPVLDAMLKPRFDHVYYLVPFYDGDRNDVIPVYGRSVFFQGYIAQAWTALRHLHFDHFVIMADDMILNPAIDRDTYADFLGIGPGQSFIPMLRPLHEMPYYWIGTMSAFTYSVKQKYVEAERELPTPDQAMQLMRAQGIDIRPLTRHDLFKDFTLAHRYMGDKLRLAMRLYTRLRHPLRRQYELSYPMVGSYSDFLVVAGADMPRFAHYCGVFAATSLFVEVAIPTALVLAASERIVTEQDSPRHGRSYWAIAQNVFCESPEYTWDNLEKEYSDLDDMQRRFPADAIYLHPVKLSKWSKK